MTNINDAYIQLISLYLRSKDENKPHLIPSVFSPDAVLSMNLKTNNISFPATTVGVENIKKVLINDFSESYENVYTFCFKDSIQNEKNQLFCNWLVGMSDKKNKKVRVGWGKYQWEFTEEKNPLVLNLTIEIEDMVILDPNLMSEIMSWLNNASYPWCDKKQLLQSMPNIKPLNSFKI